ncbi:MAG: hypothetical protein ABJF04_18900 [Reichenbachiella sp.]|uniref:outer membrane beta-barrel protein n=1 Tax=Reichenbachiella sp. TaxID=2184521 RepID=UPI003264E673
MKKLLYTLLLIFSTLTVHSQISLEAYATVGYSAMDVEKWFEQSLEDWGQVAYGGYVQGIYDLNDDLAVGAEVGYLEYFWLTRQSPFSSGVQELHFSATRVMLLARYKFGEYGFLEGGLGNNSFDEFSVFTAAIGVGYKIPVSDQLFIPLKFRTDFLTGEGITPITLSFGVSYLF